MRNLLILIGLVFSFFISNAQEKIVRMGIIGMTHDHVNAILNTPTREGMLLVGFVESNKDLAMRRLKKVNLPESLWFATIEELIEKAKPDAVCDFRSTFEHLFDQTIFIYVTIFWLLFQGFLD